MHCLTCWGLQAQPSHAFLVCTTAHVCEWLGVLHCHLWPLTLCAAASSCVAECLVQAGRLSRNVRLCLWRAAALIIR